LYLEVLEPRLVLSAPHNINVPLDPSLDQFGDQIMTIQGFSSNGSTDTSNVSFGIFDSGASAVTFSADDQGLFEYLGGGIPIRNPGGADAEGIGGGITGDVSTAGTIIADGMHAANMTIDNDGFPAFSVALGKSTALTPGIQTFIGTEQSPDLPTITGTPVLHPSARNPKGLAARIAMQGQLLDFGDGLQIPTPDISFVSPTDTLGSVKDSTDPVKIPLQFYGGDNYATPGNLITESKLTVIPGVKEQNRGTIQGGNDHFLFDTGSQLTVLSTAVAQRLGFDLNHPETTIDVQGVGGTERVAGYTLHTLVLPRTDGGTITIQNIPIYVLDVAPGIDGIVGMNAFDTADSLLLNPNDPSGNPTLSVTYFTNPDRGLPTNTGIPGLSFLEAAGTGMGSRLDATQGSSIPAFRLFGALAYDPEFSSQFAVSARTGVVSGTGTSGLTAFRTVAQTDLQHETDLMVGSMDLSPLPDADSAHVAPSSRSVSTPKPPQGPVAVGGLIASRFSNLMATKRSASGFASMS